MDAPVSVIRAMARLNGTGQVPDLLKGHGRVTAGVTKQ